MAHVPLEKFIIIGILKNNIQVTTINSSSKYTAHIDGMHLFKTSPYTEPIQKITLNEGEAKQLLQGLLKAAKT